MFGHRFDPKRAWLVLLVLFAGAAVPIQLVTLWLGTRSIIRVLPRAQRRS